MTSRSFARLAITFGGKSLKSWRAREVVRRRVANIDGNAEGLDVDEPFVGIASRETFVRCVIGNDIEARRAGDGYERKDECHSAPHRRRGIRCICATAVHLASRFRVAFATQNDSNSSSVASV